MNQTPETTFLKQEEEEEEMGENSLSERYSIAVSVSESP